MYRTKILALGIAAAVATSSPALAADLPEGLDSFRYPTELKLAIAVLAFAKSLHDVAVQVGVLAPVTEVNQFGLLRAAFSRKFSQSHEMNRSR